MYTAENAVRHEFTLSRDGPLGHSAIGAAESVAQPMDDNWVLAELENIRYEFGRLASSLHPDDRAACGYIDEQFRMHDLDHLPTELWNEDLETDLVGGILQLPNAELLKLLRWNADRQTAYQSRLDQDIPYLNDQAIQGIDRVVSFGLLPNRARQLIRKAITSNTIRALDAFESGRLVCAGFYREEESLIGLTNRYVDGADGLAYYLPSLGKTHFHELGGHALAGVENGNLIHLLDEAEIDLTFFNEAVVEHITQVALWGEPTLLRPEERTKKGGAYQINREIGHFLLEGIDLSLVGEAYLEPLDSRQPKAREALVRQLHTNLANLACFEGAANPLERIASEYNNVPCTQANGVLYDWLDRIKEAKGYYDNLELPSDSAYLQLQRTATDIDIRNGTIELL